MNCYMCPRKCGIDRDIGKGYCGADNKIRISKIMLHRWEEPVISGTNGSGAIFFSGCSLRCVYCQNMKISHTCEGKVYSCEDLAQEMLKIQESGAHNINLVTPTHYSYQIRKSIDLIKNDLTVPVVYNTSGYELAEEIKKSDGYIDIFLTDMKYYSDEVSVKYSNAPNYFEYALSSLKEMIKITKNTEIKDGIMKKGVIMRHLILPGCRHDSIKILEQVAENCDISKIKLSLMSQYTPVFCDDKYKEIKRKITQYEYESVLSRAIELGYDGFMQERSSSSEKYTPDF